MAEITKEDLKEDLTKLEENLGGMIAKGFEGVDKRFDENTEEHRQIFERFEKMDGRFEKIDERFEKIDGRFEHIEARLDRVEGDLSEIKDKMISKEEKEDLISRIELLEEKTGIIS